jgi:hypothetical protein
MRVNRGRVIYNSEGARARRTYKHVNAVYINALPGGSGQGDSLRGVGG